MEKVLKQLRGKFINDMMLPLSIVETPYFEDRLKLLEKDYSTNSKYSMLMETIKNYFNDSPQAFLECRNHIKDKILSELSNSEAYKEFNSDNSTNTPYTPIAPSVELYTEEQNGGLFISYDMVKANFQALRYANPIIVHNCKTWEEFVEQYTYLEYFKEAKQIRQEIFGKLNGKKLANIEKRLSNNFAKQLVGEYGDKFTPFSIKTDEIIFKFNGNEEDFENLEIKDRIFDSIEFRANKFKLHKRVFERPFSDKPLNVYEKEDYLNGHRRILKCVPATYYPQVYKLLNGMEINASDLIFHYENELCQFMSQLKLVK